MVKVTKMAVEKLNEIIANQKNPENIMVRIYFGGFGWGGPRLDLTLDESQDNSDIVTEYDGIKIVYNADVKKYVRNSVIDYANSWFQRGFIIRGEGTSSC